MRDNQGKVIVIVAPSGAGKTTIAKRLLKDFSEIKFSISATTRPPRDYEADGQDYFFLSEEEFDRKVEENEFLEWEYYNGNKYGTLRSEVDKMMESGYFPLLDIEVKGAKNIKKLYGSDAISIFIQPPSIDELERRLSRRGTEPNKVVKSRLEQAKEEIKQAGYFDHVIVNDDLETAYNEVKAIIEPFITD
jgi:guanylate kinase